MDHGHAQCPQRMCTQNFPICGDQQKARADEAGKEHEYAEIPDAVWINADFPRIAKGQHQRKQKAKRAHGAV